MALGIFESEIQTEKPMQNKLWIVIPYYRDPEALAQCLDALGESTYKNFDVYVRDNSEDNIYYTAAVNEGIKLGLADPEVSDFLVLNQDCYLESTTLELLKSHLTEFPECGIACPLQIKNNIVSWGGSLEAFPLGRHFSLPIEQYKDPFTTYWANGACMLLRRSVVEEIGLLDKNLRFICSDADYSFTARARGWEVHVVPAARCEHSLGSSSTAASAELTYIKTQDVIYYYEKWISGAIYSRLSCEGPKLVRDEMEAWIQKLREDVEAEKIRAREI